MTVSTGKIFLTLFIFFSSIIFITTVCGGKGLMESDKKKMIVCEKTIQDIRDCNFLNWQGFPEECDWTKLTGYPLPEDHYSSFSIPLGSTFRNVQTVYLKLENYYRPSLSIVNKKAVLFEAMVQKLHGKFTS